MAKILMPLPDRDFDTTEVAVPWNLLTQAGHEVIFATESGEVVPECDPLLLTGVIFGQLGAEKEPIVFYNELIQSEAFRTPVCWADVQPPDYDGLILPGGHAPGMRQYLGSEILHTKVAEFWGLKRPLGAICHGVLVLARSLDADSGKSVLRGVKTTCLPKYMERLAYFLTFWRRGKYYRTYKLYVQDEVRNALDDAGAQFIRGPVNLGKRGTSQNDKPAFVVEDGHYVSARWPGDAYLFTRKFMERLSN